MSGERDGNGELDQLERQVVRGSLFTHAALDKVVDRVHTIEQTVQQLVAMLQSGGMLEVEDEPDADENTPEPEEQRRAAGDDPRTRISWPAISLRQDAPDPGPASDVNCAERLHVCQAVCCRLSFALSPEEIDAGKAKWDLGNPYFIRHDSSGYCAHNDGETRGCGIYDDRPGVCRRYSCRDDGRIWKDFEAMELNHEWIDANLVDRHRILLGPLRPKMEPGETAP